MSFKSGFVNIIGRPNVGKSTLINSLLKQKLSVINQKAQTTRHRIIGIYTGDDFQMIFSDTPGIIEPHYKLQKSMMQMMKDVYDDADVLLLLVEPKMKLKAIELFLEKFNKCESTKYLVVNKIDTVEESEIENILNYWKTELKCDDYFAVSALENTNTENLFDILKSKLPEHPAYYDEEVLTDKPVKFFVSEIIREKILGNYKDEIPYSVEIIVEEFKELEHLTRISATIYANKKSHKPILIGKGGSKLKKVGTEARIDIEEFIGRKVFLEMYVKVKENWRDDDNILKQMGYEI